MLGMQEPEKLKETEGRDGSPPGQAPAMPPTGLTPQEAQRASGEDPGDANGPGPWALGLRFRKISRPGFTCWMEAALGYHASRFRCAGCL